MREVAIASNELDWSATKWPGISRKLLRNNPDTGARAALLKFAPNARLPMHMHPGGEELLVLEGQVRVENDWYGKGWYLYSPPGSKDDVYTESGAVLFVSLPKPQSISNKLGRVTQQAPFSLHAR